MQHLSRVRCREGRPKCLPDLLDMREKKTQLLDLCVSNLKVLCIVRPGVNHQSVAFKIKKFLIRQSDTALCSNFHYDFFLKIQQKSNVTS